MAIDFHQIIDRDRPTTTKTRFRADGQQVLRFDEEVTEAIDDKTGRQVLDTFGAALKDADLVILSDYAKERCPFPDQRGHQAVTERRKDGRCRPETL